MLSRFGREGGCGFKGGIVLAVVTLLVFSGVGRAGMLMGDSSAISLAEVPIVENYGSQGGGANFIIELLPVSFLSSPDIDGFRATKTVGPTTWIEEVEGTGSWLPSVRGGLSLDFNFMELDLTGGGGVLANAAMYASFSVVDIALRFTPTSGFSIGPHVGIIRFSDLEWVEDADITFSDADGTIIGVVTTFEFSPMFLILSVDYLSATFDVESTSNGWTTNDNELDMSGTAVQFGIGFRF
jgi:hypothetical protein